MVEVIKLPDDEKCVGMIEYQGTIFVATEFHVWRMVDGKLIPLSFVTQPEGMISESAGG